MASQPDIIADWLADEAKSNPGCPVLAAITAATRPAGLDEASLLAKLRLQCEPVKQREGLADAAG